MSIYIPETFAEHDPERLLAFIEAEPFGTLVTFENGMAAVSHLPFVAERRTTGEVVLLAHLARANPHWPLLDGTDAQVMFLGPHGYVSPRWYGTAPAVPTWNYAAVHVRGRVMVVEDPDRVEAIVARLTARHENGRDAPWSLDELPTRFRDAMLAAIVGIEIAVTTIEGKMKLSQNRPPEDRAAVIAALAQSPRGGDRDLAAIMTNRERLPEPRSRHLPDQTP